MYAGAGLLCGDTAGRRRALLERACQWSYSCVRVHTETWVQLTARRFCGHGISSTQSDLQCEVMSEQGLLLMSA